MKHEETFLRRFVLDVMAAFSQRKIRSSFVIRHLSF